MQELYPEPCVGSRAASRRLLLSRFPPFQGSATNGGAPFAGKSSLAPARPDEPLRWSEAVRLMLLISLAGWGLLFWLLALVF